MLRNYQDLRTSEVVRRSPVQLNHPISRFDLTRNQDLADYVSNLENARFRNIRIRNDYLTDMVIIQETLEDDAVSRVGPALAHFRIVQEQRRRSWEIPAESVSRRSIETMMRPLDVDIWLGISNIVQSYYREEILKFA